MHKALALFALLLAGCGGGGAGVGSLPPQAKTVVTQSTASAPVLVTLGDSITAGAHGSAYPPMLAAAIGAASVTDLGIGGEFSGPTSFQIPGGSHPTYGGVLADEVPQIPLNATIVTLYIGTNDSIFLDGDEYDLTPNADNIMQFVPLVETAYAQNITGIIAGIHQRVPAAKIILADVPNAAWRPAGQQELPILRQSETDMIDAFRQTLIATGLPLVDLTCDPGMYDDANFGGPTDPHPVASGFAIIANDFAQVIEHGSAVVPCEYLQPS